MMRSKFILNTINCDQIEKFLHNIKIFGKLYRNLLNNIYLYI